MKNNSNLAAKAAFVISELSGSERVVRATALARAFKAAGRPEASIVEAVETLLGGLGADIQPQNPDGTVEGQEFALAVRQLGLSNRKVSRTSAVTAGLDAFTGVWATAAGKRKPAPAPAPAPAPEVSIFLDGALGLTVEAIVASAKVLVAEAKDLGFVPKVFATVRTVEEAEALRSALRELRREGEFPFITLRVTREVYLNVRLSGLVGGPFVGSWSFSEDEEGWPDILRAWQTTGHARLVRWPGVPRAGLTAQIEGIKRYFEVPQLRYCV